jgi:hypothetical protein
MFSVKKDSGNRRQGGGGWGTPLKKRSATRIKNSISALKEPTSAHYRKHLPFGNSLFKEHLAIEIQIVTQVFMNFLSPFLPSPCLL